MRLIEISENSAPVKTVSAIISLVAVVVHEGVYVTKRRNDVVPTVIHRQKVSLQKC